ncbi:MAG: PspA/IM30 family protein [Candidatus Dormiibacterota bacterium]
MFFGIDILIAAAAAGVIGLGLRTRLGRRLIDLFRQRLGHLLDRAENPVEALDLSYQKQVEALQQVRRGVADVVTSEKRLEIQANQLRHSQERLRDQARQALLQGREDLARLALTRSQAAATQLDQLQQQVTQLRDQEAKLELTAQRLQARVENFRSQRDTLKAQYSAARASARIGETVTGISKDMGDVNLMLERARDRTQEMQARAAAIDQLVDTGALDTMGGGGDDLDRQLRAIQGETEIEAQLQRLRQEVLPPPPPGPLLTAPTDNDSEPSKPTEGG